jgi:hypothetical protein
LGDHGQEGKANMLVLGNAGKADLMIGQVIKDCKCTVARYDPVIPPGGRGEITLSIKPYSVEGQFQKQAKGKINDPKRPEAVLVLQGVLVTPYRACTQTYRPSLGQSQIRIYGARRG